MNYCKARVAFSHGSFGALAYNVGTGEVVLASLTDGTPPTSTKSGGSLEEGDTGWMLWAFWSVTILCAVVTLGVWVRSRLALMKALTWPVVEGRVVKTEIGSSGAHYYSRISYAYVTGEHGYASDRLRPNGTPAFFSREAAQATADAFPAGQPLAVHYDPRKPGRAAIELEPVGYGTILGVILTAAALAVSLLVTFSPPVSE